MGEEPTRGQSHPKRRLTVDQAAAQLGITVDAVRARVKRQTIEHVREGGRVYVFLDAGQGAASHDQGSAQYAGQAEGVHDHRDELVEELRDRVRYLEEESRRKDHLLAAALERIPAIEAPPETPGAPETGSEGSGKGNNVPDEPHHPVERPSSWWRKFFGFE